MLPTRAVKEMELKRKVADRLISEGSNEMSALGQKQAATHIDRSDVAKRLSNCILETDRRIQSLLPFASAGVSGVS